MDWLIKHETAGRLTAKGYGKTRPVANNSDDEGGQRIDGQRLRIRLAPGRRRSEINIANWDCSANSDVSLVNRYQPPSLSIEPVVSGDDHPVRIRQLRPESLR
jgi:hypothetical protein